MVPGSGGGFSFKMMIWIYWISADANLDLVFEEVKMFQKEVTHQTPLFIVWMDDPSHHLASDSVPEQERSIIRYLFHNGEPLFSCFDNRFKRL